MTGSELRRLVIDLLQTTAGIARHGEDVLAASQPSVGGGRSGFLLRRFWYVLEAEYVDGRRFQLCRQQTTLEGEVQRDDAVYVLALGLHPIVIVVVIMVVIVLMLIVVAVFLLGGGRVRGQQQRRQ